VCRAGNSEVNPRNIHNLRSCAFSFIAFTAKAYWIYKTKESWVKSYMYQLTMDPLQSVEFSNDDRTLQHLATFCV